MCSYREAVQRFSSCQDLTEYSQEAGRGSESETLYQEEFLIYYSEFVIYLSSSLVRLFHCMSFDVYLQRNNVVKYYVSLFTLAKFNIF